MKNKKTFEYQKGIKIRPAEALKNPLKSLDVFINRPLASLIVRAVFNTGVTPNMITYVSGFIGLLGAFFFFLGTVQSFIIGGLLAQLSSIIDGADGMLARAKNMSSTYGAYLDLFFDRMVDFSLLVCIGIGASTFYDDPKFMIIGVLAAGLLLLQINTFYLTRSFLNKKKTGETGEMRALQMWGILVFALFNRLDLLLYTGLAFTVSINIFHAVHFIRLGRKAEVVENKVARH